MIIYLIIVIMIFAGYWLSLLLLFDPDIILFLDDIDKNNNNDDCDEEIKFKISDREKNNCYKSLLEIHAILMCPAECPPIKNTDWYTVRLLKGLVLSHRHQLDHWKNLVDKHAATIDDLRSKCDNLESSLADAIARGEKAEKAMDDMVDKYTGWDKITDRYEIINYAISMNDIIQQYRSGRDEHSNT